LKQGRKVLVVPGPAVAATAAKVLAAVSDRAEVLDLTVEEPDIEDVIRRIHAVRR
jgi:ABC-2 type transport system ATP-binding protein